MIAHDIKPNHRTLSRRSLIAFALALAACRGRAKPRDDGKPGKPPQRIASRTVFADEVLWALGPAVRARVVGLSPMADDPRYSMVAGEWPKTTPRLGRNPGELLALAPDLVILASFSAAEYRAAIEDKVTVLILDDFTGFDGYLANLERLADALDEQDAVAVLRDRFVARRAELEAARPPLDERPTIAAWDHGYSPGSATSFDDAASSAGFINLPAREGLSGHQRIDAEQLVAWDPEWVVVSCGERSCDQAIAKFAALPGFAGLTAVTREQVIAIAPPYLGTTGEGMLDVTATIQAALLERQAALLERRRR